MVSSDTPAGERAGRGGQRVDDVVPARDVQSAHRSAPSGVRTCAPAQAPACHSALPSAMSASAWSPKVMQRREPPAWRHLAPQRREGVAVAEHGGAASGSRPRTRRRSRRATASTVAMNSWCSRWALLTSAMVGRAMAASRAISPGWFMPSSTTAQLVLRAQAQQRERHADLVVEVAGGGQRAFAAGRRTASAAIICVTVVLPLLPVTAISGRSNCARQPAAERAERDQACRALRGPPGRRPRGRRAQWRPRRRAPWRRARKSLASKRSPLQRDEQVARPRGVRVSVCTRAIGVSSVDPPGAIPESSASAWAERHA